MILLQNGIELKINYVLTNTIWGANQQDLASTEIEPSSYVATNAWKPNNNHAKRSNYKPSHSLLPPYWQARCPTAISPTPLWDVRGRSEARWGLLGRHTVRYCLVGIRKGIPHSWCWALRHNRPSSLLQNKKVQLFSEKLELGEFSDISQYPLYSQQLVVSQSTFSMASRKCVGGLKPICTLTPTSSAAYPNLLLSFERRKLHPVDACRRAQVMTVILEANLLALDRYPHLPLKKWRRTICTLFYEQSPPFPVRILQDR